MINLSKSDAIKLFYDLNRIRKVEEAISARYPENEMRCPTHLSIGQEAVAVGVSYNLTESDLAVSSHRAHAHYLAKGGNLFAMIAELYGKETGCSKGRGGSMHLVDNSVGFVGSTAIVGGTIPVGVGLALAMKYKNEKNLCCVYFGDGAVEEGVFYESLNFAALYQLPVLFVCENNMYSVYSHISKRQPTSRKIYELSAAIGVESTHCDGNDLCAVIETVKKYVNSIRHGFGPRLIEFSTYRWLEHCGPNYDNDIGYRSISEFNLWKDRDPLVQFKRYLVEENLVTINEISKIELQIVDEIDDAFQFAKSSKFPDYKTLHDYIYLGE